MIRINRGEIPAVLADNAQNWTDEYARLKAGESGVPAAAETRYRHRDIKEALKRDAHNKCVYCESRPLHVSPGDTEHIAPKSKFPEKIVEWDNLAFVCRECNQAKGEYFDVALPLIDPFNEEPSDFLLFAGAMIFRKPGSDRGLVTIKKLELDRPELVERRHERLLEIHSLLDICARMPESSARAEIVNEIRRRVADDSEYAASARAFLSASQFEPRSEEPEVVDS
jgi:uncharacterized protein (TIGR02646 family)